ncbi:TPA: recombinase RecT [Campylobacter lari]|nr:recombinase RecT [Campylobacter lari]
MKYYLGVATKYGLDPFLRQVFFVPRKAKVTKNGKDVWVEKIEPLVGRDGFLAIARKSGKFGGIRSYSEIKKANSRGNMEAVLNLTQRKMMIGVL